MWEGWVKGPLVFCDENKEGSERINSNTYIKILKSYLCPFHHTVRELTGKPVIFQQLIFSTAIFLTENFAMAMFPTTNF